MAETQIKITADTRQAERAIANLESALEGINRVSDVVGKALAGVTAAAAGVAVSFKLIADQVGDLADLGKALGMTAQQLGYLQQSAQLAGVGADELNAALFRLRGNIGEALIKGSGAASDALKTLGISAQEISRLPANEQIERITEALREVKNPGEQAALAIDLLGKQGPRLLEVAENAARLKEEAKAMGIALSDLDVRNLQTAGDAVDELGFIVKGILKTAFAELAPYVQAIAELLKEAAMEGGGIGNIIRERVIPAVKLLTQAMAVLATYFVAARLTAGIIAATTAMIKMYEAIKVATTAAAMLNAVLGKNPIIKIVGAVAGLIGAAVVVNEIGDAFDALDKKAGEISSRNEVNLKKEKELRSALPPEVQRLNQEQEKALKALEDSLTKLEQSVAFERDKALLGERQANINKMIAEEAAKLEKVGLTLSDQAKKRIEAAYTELEAIKQRVAFDKVLEGYQTEMIGLLVADKKEREIILAIRKQELEFGRALTADEQERLTNTLKQTQALREQAAIRDAITEYTREQTDLEKINRGINLQKTLGGGVAGGVTSAKEYQRDQEALQAMLDNKLISEQQYYQQREELARAYNLKVQELELKRIEQVMMAERSGMAAVMSEKDQAILQEVGRQERQRAIVQERIAFEKKSELEKAQFAIQQGATIFNALGAQNKKAFEAAKAFNIANAMMNTYMAATKALATYPWPIGLIAAAAAVASGLAQVAQIRSQTYSGRQLGGPVMANQSYIVGENGPELFTPNNSGSITRNNQLGGGGSVNVNFTIVANDTTGFDQLLASRKGMITQIINDAVLEKGRRSIA